MCTGWPEAITNVALFAAVSFFGWVLFRGSRR